jgi:hypothetical protein
LDESLSRPREAVFLLRAAKHLVISRFNEAGDEGRLHLGDCVIDRDVGTFVQDLATEDTRRGGRALLVNALEGDIEGQHLVGVPGLGNFLEAGDGGYDYARQGIDRGAGSNAVVTNQRRLIDGVAGEEDVRVGAELRTDVVDVGDELATHLVDEIQQAVTIDSLPISGNLRCRACFLEKSASS